MPHAKYTLRPGRCITYGNQEILTLHIVTSANGNYAIRPSEADTLAHEIVRLLNEKSNA